MSVTGRLSLTKCLFIIRQNSINPFKLTSRSMSSSTSNPEGPTEKKRDFHDIVIAGGGLVGTTLALALGKNKRLANRNILLLESGPKPKEKKAASGEDSPPYSNRVVAISPGSRKILEGLGIWEHLLRNKPVYTLQVWDALSQSNIVFNHPNYSSPVSFIVENDDLANAINKAVDQVENLNLKIEYGSKLLSCKLPESNQSTAPVILNLNGEKSIETSLLIGADGFNSLVRSTMGSPYLNFGYDRAAVVATLRLLEPSENNIAWQRFLPTGGPIALLPLSSEYSSLVWSTTVERAKELVQMPSDEFIDAVNSAFWKEYPQSFLVKKSIELLSNLNISPAQRIFPPSLAEVVDKSRASFPLGFGHAAFYVNRRAALIGDSAHRVHPLAGQGLNLGFGDVDCLAKTIQKAAETGADIGSWTYLKEYETERQRHNFAVQSGIDFLHRLYDTELTPIVAIRSLGLSLVNSSDMLKNFFIQRASA